MVNGSVSRDLLFVREVIYLGYNLSFTTCFLVLCAVKSLLPSAPVALVRYMINTAMCIAVPYKADTDVVTVLTYFSKSHKGIVAMCFSSA